MQTAAAEKQQSGAKGSSKLSAFGKSSYKGMGRGIHGHCTGLQGISLSCQASCESEVGIAQCCRAWHSATGYHVGQSQALHSTAKYCTDGAAGHCTVPPDIR